MRTLGYYVDNTIPAIANVEELYGSHLDGLSQSEKFWLVQTLAEDADYESDPDSTETIREEIGQLRQVFLEELEPGTKVALAIAILTSITGI